MPGFIVLLCADRTVISTDLRVNTQFESSPSP